MSKLNIDAFAKEMALEMMPEVISEIAELIGINKTVLFIDKFGGLDLQVPSPTNNNRQKQMLIEAIGIDATNQLVEVYGGDRLYIPKCQLACITLRNHEFVQKINMAVASGKTQTAAIQHYAPLYGFSERWAYKILNDNTAKQLQQDLF